MFNTQKNIIFLMQKFSENHYNLIKKIKTLRHQTKVSILNKTYIINTNQPSFISGKYFYYFIDIQSGKQLTFNELKQISLNPEIMDNLLQKNIFKQIINAVKSNKSEIIMYIALGFTLGFLISSLIFNIYYSNKLLNMADSGHSIITFLKEVFKKW
ncbi:MAG: hypothetical protein ACTSVV_08085 [Promethearchaeota archaeon]